MDKKSITSKEEITMPATDVRNFVVNRDLESLRKLLSNNHSLANEGWPADEHNPILAHPLHRICDGVYNGLYSDEYAVEVARIFLQYGADINGNVTEIKKDTPLVAAASLNAQQTGIFYVDHGAYLHHPGCHGGTALHWSAWCGNDLLLKKLINAGGEINRLCIDFTSTPLFWAAHGFYHSNRRRREQYIACMQELINAGADKTIRNIDKDLPAEVLQQDAELYELLKP